MPKIALKGFHFHKMHLEVYLEPGSCLSPRNIMREIGSILEKYYLDDSKDGKFWYDRYEIGGYWEDEHDPEISSDYEERKDEFYSDDEDESPHVMEIRLLRKIHPKFDCGVLIVNDNVYNQQDEWNGDVFTALRDLDISKGYLVTVDYHQ